MNHLTKLHLLTAALALALPAAASARPADVVIVNTAANPVSVAVTGTPTVKIDPSANEVTAKIDPSANDVDVNSSAAEPVYTKSVQKAFGASINLSASNNGVACDSFTIPAGRVIQLQSMVVGLSGPASPRAWLDFYATKTSNTALKQELEIPLRTSQTNVFAHTGQLATGFPIFGGGTFDGGGLPTSVRGCIRAAASGTNQGNLMIAGIFLD